MARYYPCLTLGVHSTDSDPIFYPIATTPATTLDGAIAKLKWVGKGIRSGQHFKIDASVLAGATADIRRLAARTA
jgi:hypothetical protein